MGVRKGATVGLLRRSLLEKTRTCLAEKRSKTFLASSQLR